VEPFARTRPDFTYTKAGLTKDVELSRSAAVVYVIGRLLLQLQPFWPPSHFKLCQAFSPV
jgi:hypothetical protein